MRRDRSASEIVPGCVRKILDSRQEFFIRQLFSPDHHRLRRIRNVAGRGRLFLHGNGFFRRCIFRRRLIVL